MSKELVTAIQMEIMRQQAALCHFRAQGITVHECMIVGEVIAAGYECMIVGEVIAAGYDTPHVINAILKAHGFKGQVLARMVSAATMYFDAKARENGVRP